jgi:hypothetical protein
LVACGDSSEVGLTIRQDPRSGSTPAELQEQFDYAIRIRDEVSRVHESIERLRQVRTLLQAAVDRAKGSAAHATLVDAQKPILEKLRSIEEALYQTQNRSSQDPLNFPIRLNDKLAGLSGYVATGDYPATASVRAVHEFLSQAIDEQLQAWQSVLQEDLPRFNRLVAEQAVPAVPIPSGPATGTNPGQPDEQAQRTPRSGEQLLAADHVVRGNLDSDASEEAVAVLSEQRGDAIFVFVAVVDEIESTPYERASVLLGDRVGIMRLEIVAGILEGELVLRGETDEACCPSEIVRLRWELRDDQLRELSREPIGRIQPPLLE